MTKYKWEPSVKVEDITILMVARNLVSLYYPFVEAIVSTIPLGCRYLIGTYGNDGTEDVINQLAKYVPIETVKIRWMADEDPGWGAAAIGIATDALLERCPTPYALVQQACEIHTPETIEYVLASDCPLEFVFAHFYGSMHHGGVGYGGYRTMPKLLPRELRYKYTDGMCPVDYDGGSFKMAAGLIHRYGYCHHNTIAAKMHNHAALYFDGNARPKIAGCIDMGTKHTWTGGHPECVQHLLDRVDYDVNFSLDYVKAQLLA